MILLNTVSGKDLISVLMMVSPYFSLVYAIAGQIFCVDDVDEHFV